jgi:hypothetical protein
MPEAPIGRKSGPIPKFAKNQTDLGKYMMPARDRKMIQRAMTLEGNPGRTPDGKYPVAAWQEFMNANFASANTSAETQPDKFKLEMEKLRLQNQKLEFELKVKQKDFTSNQDVEIWVGDMVMQAKRVLLGIPAKLAPQIVGMTEVQAELRMKEEINAALLQLTSRPLHSG